MAARDYRVTSNGKEFRVERREDMSPFGVFPGGGTLVWYPLGIRFPTREGADKEMASLIAADKANTWEPV